MTGSFLIFRKWDVVHRPRSVESLLIEKSQGRNGLDQDALMYLLIQEIELIGADVLGSELIG